MHAFKIVTLDSTNCCKYFIWIRSLITLFDNSFAIPELLWGSVNRMQRVWTSCLYSPALCAFCGCQMPPHLLIHNIHKISNSYMKNRRKIKYHIATQRKIIKYIFIWMKIAMEAHLEVELKRYVFHYFKIETLASKNVTSHQMAMYSFTFLCHSSWQTISRTELN